MCCCHGPGYHVHTALLDSQSSEAFPSRHPSHNAVSRPVIIERLETELSVATVTGPTLVFKACFSHFA